MLFPLDFFDPNDIISCKLFNLVLSIEIVSSIKDKLHLYTAKEGEETFAAKIFQQIVDRIICGIPYNKTKKHFITLDILYRELDHEFRY